MKSNRALLAVVIVSVGLNLLLAGVLLGRMAGPGAEDVRRLDPMLGARRLLAELPEERAEALAPYYRGYVSALRPRFREIRGVQRELRDAMLTDPLDATALTAALSRFQTRLIDSQHAARGAFVALAGAMTLDERRQLVERMSDPPLRRGDHPVSERSLERPGHDHPLPPPPGGFPPP